MAVTLYDMDCDITTIQINVLWITHPRMDYNFEQIYILVGDSWEYVTINSGHLSPNDEVRVLQVESKIWATCADWAPIQIWAPLDNEPLWSVSRGRFAWERLWNFPDVYTVSLGAKNLLLPLLIVTTKNVRTFFPRWKSLLWKPSNCCQNP